MVGMFAYNYNRTVEGGSRSTLAISGAVVAGSMLANQVQSYVASFVNGRCQEVVSQLGTAFGDVGIVLKTNVDSCPVGDYFPVGVLSGIVAGAVLLSCRKKMKKMDVVIPGLIGLALDRITHSGCFALAISTSQLAISFSCKDIRRGSDLYREKLRYPFGIIAFFQFFIHATADTSPLKKYTTLFAASYLGCKIQQKITQADSLTHLKISRFLEHWGILPEISDEQTVIARV